MAWCFSTRASVATVLTTHPCVSWCLRVKNYRRLTYVSMYHYTHDVIALQWHNISITPSQIHGHSTVCSKTYHANNREAIEALPAENSSIQWMPFTKGQYCGTCFHIMASSCNWFHFPVAAIMKAMQCPFLKRIPMPHVRQYAPQLLQYAPQCPVMGHVMQYSTDQGPAPQGKWILCWIFFSSYFVNYSLVTHWWLETV